MKRGLRRVKSRSASSVEHERTTDLRKKGLRRNRRVKRGKDSAIVKDHIHKQRDVLMKKGLRQVLS
jgi:hypothetical protein